MECPVCFEKLETQIETILPCKHNICLKCLIRINKCPLCRFDLRPYFPTFPSISLRIKTETEMLQDSEA